MDDRKNIFTSATVSVVIGAVVAMSVSVFTWVQKTKETEFEAKIYAERLYEQNAILKDQIEILSKRLNEVEKEVENNRSLVKALDNNLKFQTDVIKSLLGKQGEKP